jgi:hypothetical protein
MANFEGLHRSFGVRAKVRFCKPFYLSDEGSGIYPDFRERLNIRRMEKNKDQGDSQGKNSVVVFRPELYI